MSIATNATISSRYRSLEAIRAQHAAERAAYDARCRRQELALAIAAVAVMAIAVFPHVQF